MSLLFFIPFCCCCGHKAQQTVVRGTKAERALQKNRLAEKGRRLIFHGFFHILLHHGLSNVWASKLKLERQQNTFYSKNLWTRV